MSRDRQQLIRRLEGFRTAATPALCGARFGRRRAGRRTRWSATWSATAAPRPWSGVPAEGLPGAATPVRLAVTLALTCPTSTTRAGVRRRGVQRSWTRCTELSMAPPGRGWSTMRYRRVMLLTEIGADTEPALAAVRSLAGEVEHLVVAACPRAASDPLRQGQEHESRRRVARASSRRSPEGCRRRRGRDRSRARPPGAGDGRRRVPDRPRRRRAPPPAAIPVLARLRARCPVAVLWVPPSAAAPLDRPFARVLCVALGIRALRGVGAFLRDHGEPALQVALLSLRRPPPDEFSPPGSRWPDCARGGAHPPRRRGAVAGAGEGSARPRGGPGRSPPLCAAAHAGAMDQCRCWYRRSP